MLTSCLLFIKIEYVFSIQKLKRLTVQHRSNIGHLERYLSIRAFTEIMKQRTYAKQGSKCNYCEKKFEISQMEADHKIPWHKGGKSTEDNCQMLCIKCNRKKSGK